MSATAALAWLHPELCALAEAPEILAARHPRAELLLVRGAEVEEAPLAPRADDGRVALLPLRSGADAARVLERVARASEAFRRAAPIPFFAGCERGGVAVETRLLPLWRGLLPGDAYPEPVRRATRELVRQLFPARALLFRALEHHALAGIDPSAASGAAGASSRGARPLIVALCGIDGSGKSTHLAALGAHLEARGIASARFKIFRHGLFHDTVTELARACDGGKNLHLWRLERLIKAFDSLKAFHALVEPGLAAPAVALFDRYVFTHEAAATARLHHDPTRALLSVYPRPDRVYLLDLPAEVALERIGARTLRTLDENRFMLARYRERLLVRAAHDGFRVLDARAPFAANQAELRSDLDALLAARGVRA